MVFLYMLQRHEAVILLVLLAVAAIVCFYFAVRSRKRYRCPECGEQVRVEHMETARCGMCGSLLQREKENR